jgi:hypothetical protein
VTDYRPTDFLPQYLTQRVLPEPDPESARSAEHGLVGTSADCQIHTRHVPNAHVNEWHHIWPLGKGGPAIPQNRIVVCATGHNNIHHLIREFELHKGKVPYIVLRTYAKSERELALLGYQRAQRQAM